MGCCGGISVVGCYCKSLRPGMALCVLGVVWVGVGFVLKLRLGVYELRLGGCELWGLFRECDAVWGRVYVFGGHCFGRP